MADRSATVRRTRTAGPPAPAPRGGPPPGRATCAGAGPVHAVPHDCAHSPGPRLLRASATAISPMVMTSHSSTAARFQPSRRHNLRGLRLRYGRPVAGGRIGWISLRAGISSPAASRLNMPSSEPSPGSDSASSSAMDSRARCSRALRLIAAWRRCRHPRARRWPRSPCSAAAAGRRWPCSTSLPALHVSPHRECVVDTLLIAWCKCNITASQTQDAHGAAARDRG